MRTEARAPVNLLAQASTLDMSRPPWRHDRLPGGRPGTSTVKYCRSRPPPTGKRNCWEELRIRRLTSNTNMSLGIIQSKIGRGIPAATPTKMRLDRRGKTTGNTLSVKILSIDFLCFVFLEICRETRREDFWSRSYFIMEKIRIK